MDKNHKIDEPIVTRRAAAYVRMSTDHQKYSTENQLAAIQEYATIHNMELVATYADEGKSGLNIKGREGLQRMIADVEAGHTAFEVILVLDVNRWGRFQDVDESGYYEFICRKAGIAVHYVAEEFANDGGPMVSLIKAAKRSMAGEYSRELSKKVFAGQCRLIQKGYRQGGPAGYGLRRVLIDEHGQQKTALKRGEHKSLQTDRVILVPGPAEEVENVRWIYRAFTEEGLQERQIMVLLNAHGVLTDLGRSWTRSTVHEVLTNEKYIGNNVFNRTSFKLKQRRIVNGPDNWIRADGVFEAVIEPQYFYTAQGIIRERGRKFSDEEMLEKLRKLHVQYGWLSGLIINETEDMPSSSVYSHRFGSLIRAYELVGYTPDRDFSYIETNRALRKFHSTVVDDTIRKIEQMGGIVRKEKSSELLVINEELRASVVIGRCYQTDAGSFRWKIQLDTGLLPDITIAIRMSANNETALDYYLLPALDIESPKIRLAEHNGLALDSYRFDDLEPFFMLTERVAIWEAA